MLYKQLENRKPDFIKQENIAFFCFNNNSNHFYMFYSIFSWYDI